MGLWTHLSKSPGNGGRQALRVTRPKPCTPPKVQSELLRINTADLREGLQPVLLDQASSLWDVQSPWGLANLHKLQMESQQ